MKVADVVKMDAYDEEISSVVQNGCDRAQLLLPVTRKQNTL